MAVATAAVAAAFRKSRALARYRCAVCDKNFRQLEDLRRHMRTHTGERSYTCPYCAHLSTRTGYLRLDTNNIHYKDIGAGVGGLGSGEAWVGGGRCCPREARRRRVAPALLFADVGSWAKRDGPEE